MSYNHNEKAGNEGDICKHPALIAALDETVARATGTPFHYADLYAGYAQNPLSAGREWNNGIGLVAGVDLFGRNRHLSLWACCCGLQRKPDGGGFYPGSAWFAREVCNWRGKPAELSLWDESLYPFNNLKTHFPDQPNVFNSRWDPRHPAIANADFVFIDPPNKHDWPAIKDLVGRFEWPALIWLPVAANTTQTPPIEDSASRQYREGALRLGMSATVVRWAKGGQTIGCQLIYRLTPAAVTALREAVEEVVRMARLRSGTSTKWLCYPVHYDSDNSPTSPC